MKCPNCLIEIHPNFHTAVVPNAMGAAFSSKNSQNVDCYWRTSSMTCPACRKAIINITERNEQIDVFSRLIVPKVGGRRPAPKEVPPDLAEDFKEASLVISDSPKASAALSRRCLQGILRNNGFAQKDLAPAIDAAIKSKVLPAGLSMSLDAVRNIGNFAAHPMKDTQTGTVLPVEPEEAEWNLDVLEGLFDFFYVLPAREQEKIDQLNRKLAAAGKPQIKIDNQPPP